VAGASGTAEIKESAGALTSSCRSASARPTASTTASTVRRASCGCSLVPVTSTTGPLLALSSSTPKSPRTPSARSCRTDSSSVTESRTTSAAMNSVWLKFR
jgi:hypothetical protein